MLESGTSQGCLRGDHEVGGRAQGGRARPPPSCVPRESSGPSPILRGLLLVLNDLREILGQLDSVRFSFSAILKNNEKIEIGTGL